MKLVLFDQNVTYCIGGEPWSMLKCHDMATLERGAIRACYTGLSNVAKLALLNLHAKLREFWRD